MPQLAIEKLLTYSFSKSELELLLKKEEFAARRAKVETLPDFEKLCTFGFSLLHQENKLQNLRQRDLTQPANT